MELLTYICTKYLLKSFFYTFCKDVWRQKCDNLLTSPKIIYVIELIIYIKLLPLKYISSFCQPLVSQMPYMPVEM